MDQEFESSSPDGRHNLTLRYKGEIRFGPAYFGAVVNGVDFTNAVFGKAWVWSEDSSYLALQRWNTTKESDGPDTSLWVLRLSDLMIYDRPRARPGWIELVRFEGSRIVFSRDTSFSTGQVEEVEVDLDQVESWHPFQKKPSMPG